MKNEHDSLHHRMAGQPLRRTPENWKHSILDAAHQAAAVGAEARHSSGTEAGCDITPWWRSLLWPHPAAWGGLAAIWLLGCALNILGPSPPTVQRQAEPPVAAREAMQQRRQLLQELVADRRLPSEASRPESGPRSDGLATQQNA